MNDGRSRAATGDRAAGEIKSVVDRHGIDELRTDRRDQLDDLVRRLRKKDRHRIVDAALGKFIDAEQLKPYQAELIRMQAHLEASGRKIIILFDGRDASGRSPVGG